MLVAVGIAHVTWMRAKGATADRTKFQTALIGVLRPAPLWAWASGASRADRPAMNAIETTAGKALR